MKQDTKFCMRDVWMGEPRAFKEMRQEKTMREKRQKTKRRKSKRKTHNSNCEQTLKTKLAAQWTHAGRWGTRREVKRWNRMFRNRGVKDKRRQEKRKRTQEETKVRLETWREKQEEKRKETLSTMRGRADKTAGFSVCMLSVSHCSASMNRSTTRRWAWASESERGRARKGAKVEGEEGPGSLDGNKVTRIEKQSSVDVNTARCNFSFFTRAWAEREAIIITLNNRWDFLQTSLPAGEQLERETASSGQTVLFRNYKYHCLFIYYYSTTTRAINCKESMLRITTVILFPFLFSTIKVNLEEPVWDMTLEVKLACVWLLFKNTWVVCQTATSVMLSSLTPHWTLLNFQVCFEFVSRLSFDQHGCLI